MVSKLQLILVGVLLCTNFVLFYYANTRTRFLSQDMIGDEDPSSSNLYSFNSKYFMNDGKNDAQSSESRGFVFSTHIIEQQVGAAMNLLTLSQWAKHVGISVVEPFVSESIFKWPPIWSQSELSRTLRFRDYFDLNHWNSMCSNFNASPLVSWETFLKRKPDSTIVVVLYPSEHCPLQLKYIDNEIGNNSDCRTHFNHFVKANGYNINHILQTNIVRRVCIPMCKKRTHQIDAIGRYIYGPFKPKENIVIFFRWVGIAKNRFRIFETEYHRTPEAMTMLQTSKRIIEDSKNYVEKYLDSEIGQYVALSFRSVKRAKLIDPSEQPHFFKSCLTELEHVIHSQKSRKLFLALDFGRFGDVKISAYMTNDLVKMIEHDLFQVVFNGTLTMEQWEQSFIDITNGITDSGYIAGLHSNILQNSGCLVMFGGDSNFQRNILYQYNQKHTDSCVQEVCYKE